MFNKTIKTEDIKLTIHIPESPIRTQKDLNREMQNRLEALERQPDNQLPTILLEILREKAGITIYEITEDKERHETLWGHSFYSESLGSLNITHEDLKITTPKITTPKITLNDLQNIGKYEVFEVGDKKYAIVTNKKRKSNKKK